MNRGYNSSGEEILKGPAIMVVTPYQAQLTNIFDEIEAQQENLSLQLK